MMRVLLVSACLLLALGACGDPPSSPAAAPTSALTLPPPQLEVKGRVRVKGAYPAVMRESNGTCVTGGGYTDIREGAQVVVTDASAKTIGLGQIGRGSWDGSDGCIFLFKVTGVPAGQQFYGIEVSHRGRVQYTATQLIVPIELTLGG